MNQLTLEWMEAGQLRTQTIDDRRSNPRTFRIGRDPAQCDLVLQHQTVSALHVEIFFDPSQHRFFLRNLRPSNPPLVDQQRVTQHQTQLRQGSKLQLGLVELRIAAIAVAVSPTVLITPSYPPAQGGQPIASASLPHPDLPYGLRCPGCQRVSAYTRLETGCSWCGTSLAAADSVLMLPGS